MHFLFFLLSHRFFELTHPAPKAPEGALRRLFCFPLLILLLVAQHQAAASASPPQCPRISYVSPHRLPLIGVADPPSLVSIRSSTPTIPDHDASFRLAALSFPSTLPFRLITLVPNTVRLKVALALFFLSSS